MIGNEMTIHRPVMPGEVVRFLVEGQVDLLLDATVGAGGHSERFLTERGGASSVVGLDRDPEMAERARKRLLPFGDRVRVLSGSFADLDQALDGIGVGLVDGVLFDLGASSVHFNEAKRGFSFLSPGPLDMRYDRSTGRTAADLVNEESEERLIELLDELGEETRAKRIARAIVLERPIRDTLRLAEVIERALGGRGRAHPATRTFQALRLAVNAELSHVERGIPAAFRRLRPGGRLLVLTFHSGEDRLVKRLMRDAVGEGRGQLLTRKPVPPTAEEVRANRRARSARLRVCEKTREEEG
jgi:16S rRNA (cytosine1402-N4)-methyltransferase